MIEYIYFVKCPNCEDEPFSFFNDAKEHALCCLSQKPIITQVEVNRNDFGECTDSCDLGTVWSWEDMMKDTGEDPAISVFTKDDLVTHGEYDPDFDPEFTELDNSLDNIPDNFRRPNTKATLGEAIQAEPNKITKDVLYDQLVNGGLEIELDIGSAHYDPDIRFDGGGVYSNSVLVVDYDSFGTFSVGMLHYSDDGDQTEDLDYDFETESFDELWQELITLAPDSLSEACRKPVPTDMTIESLVEEMEENEDTVECKWCEELFDKSECRYEVNLGWLCDRCQAAIMSRGESLTFRENNYWDFLDEE